MGRLLRGAGPTLGRRVTTAVVLGGLVAASLAPTLLEGTSAPAVAAKPAAEGQPYAPNWFPQELLAWSPGSDPDAPYNRSTTPLAGRVVDAQTTSNPEARPRKVMALSVFADTDGNPAQGSAEFDYYTSEFWQYIDTLVFWGGSSGEGLILAPNPTVTDAAHRNGVPVYGTIFLPPTVYGGKLEWTEQLLQRDASGNFPAVAKLAEVAQYYGFDGWFVNAETEGADAELAADMRDFLADLRERTGVLWYDSMVESGQIAWQNQLNDLNDAYFDVSDLMFLNYGWNTERLASSAAKARSMDRDPAELYAGIDTGARQFGVQSAFDTLFPASGESGISVGLYRPDFTLTGTDDPSQYAARENRFWVGSDGDPSRSEADADGWKGVSAKVAESTAITRAPFSTYFNTGRGTSWWMDGRAWQSGEWNNLTVQDVLPTWRWIVRGSPLQVEYDHDFAYRGGSSLRIHGPISAATTIPLFATRVTVDRDMRLAFTQHGRSEVSMVLRFADDPDTDVLVNINGQTDTWATRSVSLARYEGRILTSIGLQLRKPAEADSIDYHLGRVALLTGDEAAPSEPSGVRVAKDSAGNGARITWGPSSSGVLRYDIEAVDAVGARTWLGSSTSSAFYSANVPLDAVRIEVVPIGADHSRGTAAGAHL